MTWQCILAIWVAFLVVVYGMMLVEAAWFDEDCRRLCKRIFLFFLEDED